MKLLCILILLPIFSFSQETTEEKVYDFVEEDPAYPGGVDAMTKFIVEHVEYPEDARKNGEQGVVYVKFIVAKSGAITGVGIRKGVSEKLSAEAIRVVTEMPNWIPGEQNGKPVAVNYTLPIHFRLSNGASKLSKKEKKKLKKELKKEAKQKKKS